MLPNREIQVLVVDDDLALCELLRTTFELEGIKVLDAQHVIEAERILIGARPDAIVLDIGLPGVDGIFYCERLRESPQTRTIPIIAISGSQEAGIRALAAGANAFAGKPFDPISLLATVERFVGIAPLETALGQAERSGESAGELRRLVQIGQRQHDLLQHSYRATLEALVRRARVPGLRDECSLAACLGLRDAADPRGAAVTRRRSDARVGLPAARRRARSGSRTRCC